MRIRATGAPLYRLRVTLRDSEPGIWRRFLVPSDIPLKRLHDALQAVMGWTESHPHQFEARGVLYGTVDRELGFDRVSERTTKLDQVLRTPRDHLTYEYDFGDGWDHDVLLETILPHEPGGMYPVVEAGERACPPEDVGGVYGYLAFLEAIRDPHDPQHHEMMEWIGGSFDPDAFSVGETNLAIHGGWVRRESDR